jgi:hypothetical protein
MRRTIYLPDDLAARVNEYLCDNKTLSLSALVQRALERELDPPDLSPLLELAGMVKEAAVHARDHAEDRVVLPER